jgi:hypothetical protein
MKPLASHWLPSHPYSTNHDASEPVSRTRSASLQTSHHHDSFPATLQGDTTIDARHGTFRPTENAKVLLASRRGQPGGKLR